MNEEITILPLDPTTFEIQNYNTSDTELIAKSELDTVFSSSTDYIEYYVYDENQTLLYPQGTTTPLTSFNVKQGDVLLDPQSDLENLGFDIGKYSITYDFYRRRLGSNINENYYIKEISSDRTEIRLDSNNIDNQLITSTSTEFIQYRENQPYFVDFYLNFGGNKLVIANNLSLDTQNSEDPTILIKLYEPLPEEFDLKTQLWVVELLSKPQAYQVDFPFIPIIEDDFTYIAGPNFNLNVTQELGNSSQTFSYTTLLSSNVTSSVNQIKSLLNEKEININVNYEDFSDFVHFSTALTRLENFYYKVGLIENYTNELSTITSAITSDTTNTVAYSSSLAVLNTQIDTIIHNFDGYEYFMYFNSGSSSSYPKTNTTPPFTLASTGSVEALTWLGSADEGNAYYGGTALSASLYDEENQDRLYNSIPEYLREDPNNYKYELFVDMVSQHYDNIWLYTKDVTNKFNADNRLDYGISKDLISDAIKDFGVKLYSNGFNNTDLYSAFLGITPSGSSFPFPDMTGSLPTPSGYEYVDTQISSSDTIVPLNDINKRLYKRIYHNIPYLLKTKGTIAGLRALITSYGIPDTILRVNEFGGKDRNESQDWDLKQNVFNYAFNTGVNATNFISSSLTSNSIFAGGDNPPQTIQFRFKPTSIPLPTDNIASSNIRYSQSLFSTNDGGNLVLEYTGSGLVSGSYQGAIASPYDLYGTLKWVPAQEDDPSLSASVYLPLFNNDWWSVQINTDINANSSSLYVANEIDGKLGFNSSSSISGFDSSYYNSSSIGYLNKDTNIVFGDGTTYTPFSGSFQELRYWTQEISQSNFYDFTLNPYSAEGNGVNTTPDQLYFRADLGTQLDVDSRTSIHPRITGSLSQVTSSFDGGSDFYINTANFISNKENLYQDQVPSGIKNRVTDKIALENLNIAEAPYGFPSGSNTATISTQESLSAFQSIQQESFTSSSYTPDVNYLEVAFSPANQINDDINAQLGYFNLGDYIGDPRQISSTDRSYPNLDTLRDSYFEKYIKSYDIVDFVRLIKFFDNSLFKMIKDFTPARTSLASGVVVKQHLLERNRQRPAQASWENVTYSGSIKPQSRNFNTGSGDVGQYESTGGSSIYKFTGGTGGSLERYNGLNSSPSASAYGLTNKFNLTQSYSESIEGSKANQITNDDSFLGYNEITVSDQKEFYDGEFNGSNIVVTTQSLNPGCAPYLTITDQSILFNPIVFNLSLGVSFQGTVIENEILLNTNSPNSGDAWIVSEQISAGSPYSKVKYIKLSNIDTEGISIKNRLEGSPSIKWITSDADVPNENYAAEYIIEGITTFANSTLLKISQTKGNNVVTTLELPGGGGTKDYFPITSSQDAGSENWSLIARGNYTSSDSLGQSSDDVQQGNFIFTPIGYQKQYFWYWNGEVNDAQSFFNTGSDTDNTSIIKSDPTKFNFGSYNPKRTSNIPWVISASIAYSASDLGTGGTVYSTNNIYHSASKYTGVSLYDQDFGLDRYTSFSGVFKPSPLVTSLNSSFFTTTYNNQIPGDSGSLSGQVGGHPKIKLEGTASLDFYFPSLTIGGTPRSLEPGTPKWVPLSGSALNSNNDDFSLSFASTDLMDWSSSLYPNSPLNAGFEEDGAVEIDWTYLEELIAVSYGHYYGEILIPNFDITYNLFISASVSNYTASIQTNNYVTSSNGLESTGWVDTPETYKASNREINIAEGTVTALPYFTMGTNPKNYTSFRIVLQSPEPDFEYYISNFDGILYVDYTHNGTAYSNRPIPKTTDAFSSLSFHSSSLGPQEFTSSLNPSGEAYPTVDIQVHLKRTGSATSPGGDIITSSLQVTNEEIFGGKTFVFGDNPIENIYDENKVDDMYFIEYSMSNYNYQGDFNNNFFDVSFIESGDTGSKIIMEQTASSAGSDYDLTGSLFIEQGNSKTPTQMGSVILQQVFTVPNSGSSGVVNLTGQFGSLPDNFKYNDTFRMSVEVSKSFGAGLTITEYSMSIFPSQSIYAPLPSTTPSYDNYKIPTGSGFFLPTYFGSDILPFSYALDCQPTLNNFIDARQSSHIMDVDYTTESGSIIPVNQQQILSGIAVKATVQDSNYTTIAYTSLRYEGSKATSQYLNVWSPKDIGTYGKLPVIESRDAYFGYFNNIVDSYPLLNNKTRINLNYLIDQEGNAFPPSLDDVVSKDVYEKTFPKDGLARISVSSGSEELQVLNNLNPIHKVGQYPVPIMYTQTSSRGYVSELPLTGSGRISLYDNPNNPNSFTEYSFTVVGTSSLGNGVGGLNVSTVLDPTENLATKSYASEDAYSSLDGVIHFVNDTYVAAGSDTSQQHYIDLETSIPTTYVYDSDYNRNGSFWRKHKHTENLELTLKLGLLYSTDGSTYTNLPFKFEDIGLKVWKTDGSSTDLGSVSDKVKYVQSVASTKNGGIGRRRQTSTTYSYTGANSIGLNSLNQAEIQIDNDIVVDILKSSGFGKATGTQTGGDIAGLEWVLKANSGDNSYKKDSRLKWEISGSMLASNGEGENNSILPASYTGPVTPTTITLKGAKTYLLEGDNTGSAPFWVFGSELPDNISINTSGSNILFMSSSNMNEAYGDSFKQGALTYTPGPSEDFPGGSEPVGTIIGETYSTLKLKIGDEIRFGNNENYSYKIVKITPPSQNIMDGSIGRLKIELDKPLPYMEVAGGQTLAALNKDFFLIRRYVDNINTIYLDIPFPYGTLPTGSNSPGILYPDFPTEYLQNSSSIIVTDLISKGVIT